MKISYAYFATYSDRDLGDAVAYPLSRLEHTRSILSSAWLRFALNSVPTASRLHDNKSSSCPWCAHSTCDLTHVLTCDVFETPTSFLELGPKWSMLQSYLNSSAATRLATGGAIAHKLGMHRLLCNRKTFDAICLVLFIRLHSFTSMRKDLTNCEESCSSDSSSSSSSSTSSSSSRSRRSRSSKHSHGTYNYDDHTNTSQAAPHASLEGAIFAALACLCRVAVANIAVLSALTHKI